MGRTKTFLYGVSSYSVCRMYSTNVFLIPEFYKEVFIRAKLSMDGTLLGFVLRVGHRSYGSRMSLSERTLG